jgi:hypothetical protein
MQEMHTLSLSEQPGLRAHWCSGERRQRMAVGEGIVSMHANTAGSRSATDGKCAGAADRSEARECLCGLVFLTASGAISTAYTVVEHAPPHTACALMDIGECVCSAGVAVTAVVDRRRDILCKAHSVIGGVDLGSL